MYGNLGTLRRTLLIVISAFACGTVFAGSPPLITDDPETPGYRGWEINITSSLEHTRDGVTMENPLFDFNYGLTSDRDQLKVEFAVLENDPVDAESEWGMSDLSVGYKYRFLDADENHGWAVAFFPQVSSPTGDEDRGLGSGQTELLIPFEFQKHFCDDKGWINPEIGYNIVLGDNDFNSWKLGLAAGWAETEKLELQGEVGAFVFPGGGEPDNPFFNFGFVYKIDKNVNLLGSAGRGFRSSEDGTPDFFCRLGFQFLLGPAAKEENPTRAEGGGGDEKMKQPGDTAEALTYPRQYTALNANQDLRRGLANPAAY